MHAIDFLRHTPVWVYAVLLALLIIGGLQTRTRQRRLRSLLLIALGLGAWSLAGVLGTLGHGPAGAWVLLAWLAGAAGVAWLGQAWFARHVQPATDGPGVLLAGSWWPLAAMLCIFCLRYAMGAGAAMHAAWLQATATPWVLSALLGAASGVFQARALAAWRVSRASASSGAAAPC